MKNTQKNYGSGSIQISLADGFMTVHHGQHKILLHHAFTGEKGNAEVRVKLHDNQIHITKRNCGVIKLPAKVKHNPQLWGAMWEDIRTGKGYVETMSNLMNA
jgi:hypothetical protein